jgi:hypothetical protein
MPNVDSKRLIEYGEYPEIYADGVGDAHAIGTNLSILLFRWRRVDGIFQRCVSAELVRPMANLFGDMLLLKAALHPAAIESPMVLH